MPERVKEFTGVVQALSKKPDAYGFATIKTYDLETKWDEGLYYRIPTTMVIVVNKEDYDLLQSTIDKDKAVRITRKPESKGNIPIYNSDKINYINTNLTAQKAEIEVIEHHEGTRQVHDKKIK